MIDLHFHALPGIDDGPPTVEDSVELVEAARRAGTRVVVATPHIDFRHGVAPRGSCGPPSPCARR